MNDSLLLHWNPLILFTLPYTNFLSISPPRFFKFELNQSAKLRKSRSQLCKSRLVVVEDNRKLQLIGSMSIIPKEPELVMKQRDGSVLGKKTILKSDHFPGCHNKRLFPHVDGAPNYRKANSLPVHGVAIPTIDGIRNVLNHIGAHMNGEKIRVLWINLREEPVLYINSRPFVLRDVEKPFSNLEYTGINRDRVEQMEDRLKDDVLIEAARYGNKILVTDELPDGQMVDQWEPVSHESIKTPLEVYEELTQQYLVDYERVPVTDEKSPKEHDFDILIHKISQANVKTEIIFNCQMGRGRTTTGMVIATLIYINRIGASGDATLGQIKYLI